MKRRVKLTVNGTLKSPKCDGIKHELKIFQGAMALIIDLLSREFEFPIT